MNRARAWLAEGDRWIPLAIILAFLLVLAVNFRMAWIAIATHPGLVTDGPRMAAPVGASILAPSEAEAMRAAPVVVRFAAGRAAASARLVAERPSRYAQAVAVPLAQGGDGLWRGTLRLPIGGTWVLTARAETPAGPETVRRTLEVRPGQAP